MALSVRTIKEELESIMMDKPATSSFSLDYCLNLQPKTIHFLRRIFQMLCSHYNTRDLHNPYIEYDGIPDSSTHSHRAYYFPAHIQDHISHSDCKTFQYKLPIRGREVTIDLVCFKEETRREMEDNQKIITLINTWLLIATDRIPPTCSRSMHIYLYFTDFKKVFPTCKEKDNSISVNHVNSAYTTSCAEDTSIVIYRKEEWFKVFIHETFHCLGLDFSHTDLDHSTFVDSHFNFQDVNYKVFESYCETWARIMNTCFSAFATLPKTSMRFNELNFMEYCTHFSYYMFYEILFSSMQMQKTLSHINIKYDDIIKRKHNDRMCNYNETTSVLSYYIFTGILMNNFQEFIDWCSTNHKKGSSIFQFDDSNRKIISYCNLIYRCSTREHITDVLSIYNQSKYKPKHNSFMMTYIPGPTEEHTIRIIV